MENDGPELKPLFAVIAVGLVPGAGFGLLAAWRSETPLIAFAFVAIACAVSAALMWAAAHRFFARGVAPLQAAIDAFHGGRDVEIDVADAPGEIAQAVQTLREAAASRLAREAELEKALERNQILTREVHHRVQNNVQVLLSLVNRAQRRTEDRAARAAIAELGANMLPVTGAFAAVNPPDEALIVDGGGYLHRLAGQLQLALGGQGRGVRLNTAIELGMMSIDDAVDLGLIVAEVLLSAHPGAGEQSPLLADVSFSPPTGETLGSLKASVAYDDPARQCRKLDTVLITELARQMRAKVEFPAKNSVAISWTAVPS